MSTRYEAIKKFSIEEMARQLAGEQVLSVAAFLRAVDDEEMLHDYNEEVEKAWSELVKEKIDWLNEEAVT